MKKLLLGLILLILFAGATLFLLDVTDVYTFDQLQKQLTNQAQQWPVIGEYIGVKQEKEKLQQQLNEIKTKLSTSQEKNTELNRDLQNKEEQIANLKKEVTNLESQLAARDQNQQEYQTKVNKLANIYNEMEPAKAADVLANLRTELTVDILNELENDAAAGILNQMPTEVAVEISSQVTTTSN